MKKVFYYCTCSPINYKSTGKYRLVDTNEEGICLNCDHYAVASNKEIKEGNVLYNIIKDSEVKGDNFYIGSGLVHKVAEKLPSNEFKPEFNPSKKLTKKQPKLNKEQKKKVVKLLDSYSQKELAQRFGVSVSTIAKLVPKNRVKYQRTRKFTTEQVRDIREQAKTRTQVDIAKDYGVDSTAISQLVRGKTYKDVV